MAQDLRGAYLFSFYRLTEGPGLDQYPKYIHREHFQPLLVLLITKMVVMRGKTMCPLSSSYLCFAGRLKSIGPTQLRSDSPLAERCPIHHNHPCVMGIITISL